MFTLAIFILLVLLVIFRRREGINKVKKWTIENGYDLITYHQEWFNWGPYKKHVGMHVVFFVTMKKGTDQQSVYFVFGHWLWGLLDSNYYIDKEIL